MKGHVEAGASPSALLHSVARVTTDFEQRVRGEIASDEYVRRLKARAHEYVDGLGGDGSFEPLSVRCGGPAGRARWKLKGLRERVALRLAPWLR